MNLMARLKARWRRHDEKLLKEGIQGRAVGADDDPSFSMQPGLYRTIDASASNFEEAQEHEGPK
jgi:hypothetical protein